MGVAGRGWQGPGMVPRTVPLTAAFSLLDPQIVCPDLPCQAGNTPVPCRVCLTLQAG